MANKKFPQDFNKKLQINNNDKILIGDGTNNESFYVFVQDLVPENDIKSISVNGSEIIPIDGNVNINVITDKTDIGLGNVDNTSDLNKPISNPTKNYVDNQILILEEKRKVIVSNTPPSGIGIDGAEWIMYR